MLPGQAVPACDSSFASQESTQMLFLDMASFWWIVLHELLYHLQAGKTVFTCKHLLAERAECQQSPYKAAAYPLSRVSA